MRKLNNFELKKRLIKSTSIRYIRQKYHIDETGVYPLDVLNWSLKYKLAKCTCVYFLFHNDELVYIGQTKNENRLLQHTNKIFDEVYFFPTKEPYNISIESKLLKIYKTKYNKR